MNEQPVSLLAHLNEQQRAAVEPGKGVFLVRAGAGSGKTRVITRRIAHLIAHHKADPSSIVALTFTNKAANEMKERVAQLAQTATAPAIGTFHAYCLRLLKTNRHLLPLPDFTIMDEDDRDKLIQKIVSAAGFNKQISSNAVSHAISNAKNQSTTGSINFSLIDHPVIQDLCMTYEKERKLAHCLDFDDLLIETIALFKNNPSFRASYQSFVRHVLVDEYQDTNLVQHALLRFMTCDNQGLFALDSLCVVGDEDQSIYSWRGATVHNILEFSKDFPQTVSLVIEQNYRSVQPILSLANEIINNNVSRHPKNLWSERKGKDRIRLVKMASDRHEADLVARLTSFLKKFHPTESCAVLYRSHHQSRSLEEALLRHSLSYKIIGGIQFYERQEVKDLLAYLRLAVNPYDRVSFSRIYNAPTRGLGAKFEELFFELWSQEPLLPFNAIAQKLIDSGSVAGAKKSSLAAFCELFSFIAKNNPTPTAALELIVQKTEYLSYLSNAFDKSIALEKIENVRELASAIQAAEDRGCSSLEGFLNEVALVQDHASKADRDDGLQLQLMTYHAAKGLEFDTVVLAGLEDGLFPTARSLDIPASFEEERRLLYVGITRARERLLMTHAQQRYVFGRVTQQIASRFIEELPKALVPHEDGSQWAPFNTDRFLETWLTGKASSFSSSSSLPQTPRFNRPSFTWDPEPFGPAKERNESFDHQGYTPSRTPSTTTPSFNTPLGPKTNSSWRPFQTVQHKSFGVGVIKEVEERSGGIINLTIHFSCGVKKINASFVSPHQK